MLCVLIVAWLAAYAARHPVPELDAEQAEQSAQQWATQQGFIPLAVQCAQEPPAWICEVAVKEGSSIRSLFVSCAKAQTRCLSVPRPTPQ